MPRTHKQTNNNLVSKEIHKTALKLVMEHVDLLKSFFRFYIEQATCTVVGYLTF